MREAGGAGRVRRKLRSVVWEGIEIGLQSRTSSWTVYNLLGAWLEAPAGDCDPQPLPNSPSWVPVQTSLGLQMCMAALSATVLSSALHQLQGLG